MLQDTIRIMLNREFNILKKSLLLFFRTILIWVMLPETSGEIQYFLLVLMFHIFEVPVWKLYQSAWCEKQKYIFYPFGNLVMVSVCKHSVTVFQHWWLMLMIPALFKLHYKKSSIHFSQNESNSIEIETPYSFMVSVMIGK